MLPLPSVLAAARLAGHLARSAWSGGPALSTGDRLAAIAGLELPTEAPVTIHWNDYQVPFVEARNDRCRTPPGCGWMASSTASTP